MNFKYTSQHIIPSGSELSSHTAEDIIILETRGTRLIEVTLNHALTAHERGALYSFGFDYLL